MGTDRTGAGVVSGSGRGVSNALILLAGNLKQNKAQSTRTEPTHKGVN